MIGSTDLGSDLRLSQLVLGMWRIHTLSKHELDDLIYSALELGITSFDHADIYGGYSCEEAFGNWYKHQNIDREEVELISKCGIKLVVDNKPEHRVKHYDTSTDHIIHSVETSLKKLNTDYLDLLLIHRPDPLMRPDEVCAAFDKLMASGKVRHFGVSNFTSDQLDLLQDSCDMPLLTNQIEISLFHNQPLFDGTLDRLMKRRLRPMAWSPLGGAKNIMELTEQPAVIEIAQKYAVSPGVLILSWLMQHPAGIVPVVGTMNTARLKAFPQAINLIWDRQDWFYLLQVVRGQAVA
ncbi:MAG: aldo/keto reductase [Fulvivirga sp.]